MGTHSMICGEYAGDWKQIATRVKDESNWKCVRCDHPHDPKAGRCLTVHHFNGDKACNEPWNLMALCQACHLSVQARVNPMVGLLVMPAAWSMPYIVGFYEAGNGTPGPLYNVTEWKRMYEESGRTWPEWCDLSAALARAAPDRGEG